MPPDSFVLATVGVAVFDVDLPSFCVELRKEHVGIDVGLKAVPPDSFELTTFEFALFEADVPSFCIEFPKEHVGLMAEVIRSPVWRLYVTDSSTYRSAVLGVDHPPCLCKRLMEPPAFATILADVRRNECPTN